MTDPVDYVRAESVGSVFYLDGEDRFMQAPLSAQGVPLYGESCWVGDAEESWLQAMNLVLLALRKAGEE